MLVDTWQAMCPACRTHSKPCVNMHASGNVYEMGGDQFEEEGRNIKEMRRKKKKEIKEKKKREREKGRKESRCSDGQNLSD